MGGQQLGNQWDPDPQQLQLWRHGWAAIRKPVGLRSPAVAAVEAWVGNNRNTGMGGCGLVSPRIDIYMSEATPLAMP